MKMEVKKMIRNINGVEFSISVSAMRGEVYIYDKDDNLVFTVQLEDNPIVNDDIEVIEDFIINDYWMEIQDLCGRSK